jgi:hypothetical protein
MPDLLIAVLRVHIRIQMNPLSNSTIQSLSNSIQMNMPQSTIQPLSNRSIQINMPLSNRYNTNTKAGAKQEAAGMAMIGVITRSSQLYCPSPLPLSFSLLRTFNPCSVSINPAPPCPFAYAMVFCFCLMQLSPQRLRVWEMEIRI